MIFEAMKVSVTVVNLLMGAHGAEKRKGLEENSKSFVWHFLNGDLRNDSFGRRQSRFFRNPHTRTNASRVRTVAEYAFLHLQKLGLRVD